MAGMATMFSLVLKDGQRDKLYRGKGRDEYVAGKNDYVDSSCEKKVSPTNGLIPYDIGE